MIIIAEFMDNNTTYQSNKGSCPNYIQSYVDYRLKHIDGKYKISESS